MTTVNQVEKHSSKLHGSQRRSIEYKSIYCLVFSSFLVAVCLSSIAKKLAHPLTSSVDQHRESPIAAARSAADSSVPYVFSR